MNRDLKEQVFGQVYCLQEALHKRKTFSRVSPFFMWEVMAWTVRKLDFFLEGKSHGCGEWVSPVPFVLPLRPDIPTIRKKSVKRESRLSVHIMICMYEVSKYVWWV